MKTSVLAVPLLAALLAAAPPRVPAQVELRNFDGTAVAAPRLDAPAQPEAPARGRDVTEEFLAASARPGADAKAGLGERLRGYKVLLVPGLFSNVDKSRLPVAGIFFSSSTKPRYEEHMAVLRELGVEHERLALQTESSVRVNGAEIARHIRASDNPVILLASSKAGLDVLAGLLASPELHRKVRGVAMLQAPFYGTPIADAIIDEGREDSLLGRILGSLGGSIDCLNDLTTEKTGRYMERNASAIVRLTAAVPVISVATWVDKPPKGEQDTGLKLLRNYLLKRGYTNDGLVPVESALLPGSDFVKLPGADHGATAQPTKLAFDRAAMTRALLEMLLAR